MCRVAWKLRTHGIREPPFDGLTAVRVGDCRWLPLPHCTLQASFSLGTRQLILFRSSWKFVVFLFCFYILGKGLNFMAFPMKILVSSILHSEMKIIFFCQSFTYRDLQVFSNTETLNSENFTHNIGFQTYNHVCTKFF